jgi:transcriptional regulator with XRE-family HTH domain
LNNDLNQAVGALATEARILRAANRLTQRAAAKKAGIGVTTWSKIERGKSLSTPLWVIIKIATAFKRSPNALLGYRAPG